MTGRSRIMDCEENQERKLSTVDLHLHTNKSDGTLTPTELVDLCAARGLRIIAISDHDSTEGVGEALEAAKRHPNLTVIPAIELSTDVAEAEIHLLGYFVNYEDPGLQSTLQRFRDGREIRGQRMVEKLNELGINVSWERVREIAGDASIGRPHMAQAMTEAGYVQYPKDAFDRHLGRNGLAYVEREKLTPVQAVGILLENGALPVIAHPTYSAAKSGREGITDLRHKLLELKAAGLVGMEVHYGDYTSEQVRWLKDLSDELGLIPCGGSDYHGLGNPNEPEPGSVGPPVTSVERLKALLPHRKATAE